ncbi:MAG: ThuA domain-containing protein [Clostridia bacterium]|nr:ThuA domain-containing protein [Clostridia bacterium]
MINVTVWCEYRQAKWSEDVKAIYPNGIKEAIKEFLDKDEELNVRTACLDDPDCGLNDEQLNNTDVLIWWAHVAHHEVPDALVKKIHERVLLGMGLIVLHSGHFSKIIQTVLGTSCSLKWYEHPTNCRERIWCTDPSHPIAEGIGDYFELEHEEMYGEFFDIPKPDSVVFTGWFNTGHVFRSGCTWTRGYGKIFYFQPGHEQFPIYYNENIQRIINNAVKWAYSPKRRPELDCPNAKPLEEI